jgi:hypothetical protein
MTNEEYENKIGGLMGEADVLRFALTALLPLRDSLDKVPAAFIQIRDRYGDVCIDIQKLRMDMEEGL